jgi:hypothetical protein
MDESPNPSENEDPGARLNHFYRPDEKKAPGGFVWEKAGGALTNRSRVHVT